MDPPLCAGGCGFYGSSAANNLCSRCSKLYAKARQEAEATKNCVLALTSPSRRTNEFSGKESVDQRDTNRVKVDVQASSDPSLLSSSGTKKTRCKCCNKKCGVIGYHCRCGETFCGTHRYPELHACKHDFKKEGRVAIEKANPVCKADKLTSRVD